MNKQVHVFTCEELQVKAVIKDNYVEFNFYAPNREWRRFFVSTVGYMGTNEELEEVGLNLYNKHFKKSA